MNNVYKLKSNQTKAKKRKIGVFETINEIINNPNKFDTYYSRLSELINNTPYGFREYLRYLRVTLGYSREMLEETSGISHDTIKEIEIKKDRGYTLETLIALCIGMSLPPDFSFELLKKAGYTLENNNHLNCLYKFILRNLYNCTIEEINQFLIKNEQQPLTRKK